MAKNATNIRYGPTSIVQISGSFGTTDIGYVEGVDITYEPTPIPINDGQQFQSSGLAKCESRGRQSDSTLMGNYNTMKSEEGYIIVTDIAGKVYTCGPALATINTIRGFESGESHTVVCTIQKQVDDEDDFTKIT